MSLIYQRFNVYRIAGGAEIFAGSVDAQTAEEAIYRLFGGEYGRGGFVAYRDALDPYKDEIGA